MSFRSPVGLAAGFDKNCEILPALPDLGFGFAEIGTVTPRPQPGNERPRLFRDRPHRALFNRMGFNNLGAEIIATRLKEARARLPTSFRVGVNIGKNKDTALSDAPGDYRAAARPFDGLADYLVINVSSPNTPGLRSLQSVEALEPIVREVLAEVSGWERRVPVLLKLAPELGGEELQAILRAGERWGVAGWVLTNTLGGGWPKPAITGGYSGAPLAEAARTSLASARAITSLPIISVGGILSPKEAAARIEAGAQLVQIYSGWIYEGPRFPAKISSVLAKQ
jgi:dihydroorotate dehydrogenase